AAARLALAPVARFSRVSVAPARSAVHFALPGARRVSLQAANRSNREGSMASRQVPVTILTGFLGSGKTTLLNRILKERHGHRIAVIENEFGEEGVDNELLLQDRDEQIVEMNNGCICCTVRGDLVRILGDLRRRRDAGEIA